MTGRPQKSDPGGKIKNFLGSLPVKAYFVRKPTIPCVCPSGVFVIRGGGVHRQFEDSHIHSPISKKKISKSKSVAELRNSLISENNGGGWGRGGNAPNQN